jgi:hypothetical protein
MCSQVAPGERPSLFRTKAGATQSFLPTGLIHSYFAARGREMAKILSGCNRTGGMLGMMLVANSAAAIYRKFHKSLRALLGNNPALNKVKAPGS